MLIAAGRRPFGSVLSGYCARLLLDAVRLAESEPGRSVEVGVRLLAALLADARGREDLDQRERRLRLEEGKGRRSGPTLGEYIKAKYGGSDGAGNGAGDGRNRPRAAIPPTSSTSETLGASTGLPDVGVIT